MLLGKNIRDVFPPELAEDFLQRFKTAGKDETQVFEYKHQLNGSARWFEARVVQSGEDVLTLLRDVTSRKAIEDALKQNEAQLAGIIGSAMDGIVTINEQQQIMLFNAAAEKMFQLPAGDAIGQPIDRFIPERFRQANREQIRVFGQMKRHQGLAGAAG
jgi:PAS domain-containing protein